MPFSPFLIPAFLALDFLVAIGVGKFLGGPR
jgi:hypothetical protein